MSDEQSRYLLGGPSPTETPGWDALQERLATMGLQAREYEVLFPLFAQIIIDRFDGRLQLSAAESEAFLHEYTIKSHYDVQEMRVVLRAERTDG